MIATLHGTVSEKLADQVVVDVSGVGYGILVTTEEHGRLTIGEKTKFYIYEHIRESSHDLFGFCDVDAKKIFEQLLSVNGVGPKMALNILSIGTNSEVRIAIANGDTKFIQAANGVGKRVAERLVIELKDKVGLDGVDLNERGLLVSDSVLIKDEAVQALVSLGYSPQDATAALSKIDKSLPIETRIKNALRTVN